MNYGEKIIALRKTNGMTQAELGEELHVTYQAVSKWERGEANPDFETLSKIAKMFGVSVGYFEDGGELATALPQVVEAEPAPASEAKAEMLGMCRECGKVVYAGEEYQREPFILCKSCHDRKIADEKKRKEDAIATQKLHEEIEKDEVKRKRNIGLIVASVVFAALAILGGVMFGIGEFETYTFTIVAWVIFCVCAFTFTSQMVWGGLVSDICTFGFVKVNFPGIIFSLDIDGILFFIFVKLLFGFFSIFLWLIFGLITSLIAIAASPIIFIPKVIRMSMGKDDAD